MDRIHPLILERVPEMALAAGVDPVRYEAIPIEATEPSWLVEHGAVVPAVGFAGTALAVAAVVQILLSAPFGAAVGAITFLLAPLLLVAWNALAMSRERAQSKMDAERRQRLHEAYRVETFGWGEEVEVHLEYRATPQGLVRSVRSRRFDDEEEALRVAVEWQEEAEEATAEHRARLASPASSSGGEAAGRIREALRTR